MQISKPKILFILSRILGNKTFSNQMANEVSRLSYLEPIIMFIDDQDYKNYNANRLLQKNDMLESYFVVKNKFRDQIEGNIDYLFLQGIDLVLFFHGLVKKYPTILAHDSTNRLSSLLTLNQNLSVKSQIKYHLKDIILTPFFNKILRDVDVFMPRTSWCASSLINDFHVPSEKIIITPCSFDINVWRPLEHKDNGKPILLFVTNNFQLKGGEFLLDLYTKYLSRSANLRIISNDPFIDKINIPEGVEVIQGIDHSQENHLIDLYRTADLLLHPTRKDFLPIVIIEACAVGLPIISNNIGAISELVSDGHNGYLMEPTFNQEEWVKNILNLITDKERMKEYGKNSRRIVEKKYSLELFSSNVKRAFSMIGVEDIKGII